MHCFWVFLSIANLSRASNGPQVKTTDPMVWNKVTDCGIQSGWILAPEGFANNHLVSHPGAKKYIFFSVRMYIVSWLFFSWTIFSTPFNQLKGNWKPTIALTKWRADEFLVHVGPHTLLHFSSTLLVFSKYLENDLNNFDEI